MYTFLEWITNLGCRLWLVENYDLNPAEYDRLFDEELRRLLPRISDPDERNRLQQMVGTRWTAYLAASLKNSFGYRDQQGLQEKIHDVVVRLLVSPGGLFRDYDPMRHGDFTFRWRASVRNAIINMVAKERNRRRLIPTIPIGQEFRPGSAMDVPDRPSVAIDEKVIEDFRRLVLNRIGSLALAILDARLAGQETKSLVGRSDLGTPSHWAIKQAVQATKNLSREFAERLGDPAFQQQIARAMDKEATTVRKRLTTAGRQPSMTANVQ